MNAGQPECDTQRDKNDVSLKEGDLWNYVNAVDAYRYPGDRSTAHGKASLLRFRS